MPLAVAQAHSLSSTLSTTWSAYREPNDPVAGALMYVRLSFVFFSVHTKRWRPFAQQDNCWLKSQKLPSTSSIGPATQAT
jgi:hypothetical protein